MANTFCVANETELIAALDDAEDNGADDVIKIQIKQDPYYGNFVYASTESFGVTIEGGYTALCASRVVDPTNTILDGGGAGRVLTLNSEEAPTFVVEGITLQYGYARKGGGISIENSSLTIRNCKLMTLSLKTRH